MISSFKDNGERIDQLECGYKHVIARSTLGKIYTWGWGAKGQLGHGHFDSEIQPRMLGIERNKGKREKVVQVAAGYSNTVVMVEGGREVWWWGTCGSLQGVNRPIQAKLGELFPDLFPESSLISSGQSLDFAVVKVTSSWSKSLSLTNLLVADLRPV